MELRYRGAHLALSLDSVYSNPYFTPAMGAWRYRRMSNQHKWKTNNIVIQWNIFQAQET
jgi:hypothetical protein